MESIKGQTAVVTGGGTGVGAAIALALAGAGADVHLVGRRLENLNAVAAKARGLGSSAECHSFDLAAGSGQMELAQQLVRRLPRLDILVQSAGVHCADLVERSSLSDFDLQYQTNVRAPYVLAQALLPTLKVRKGQMVFINSSSGVVAKPGTAQYDSTKHALRAIADSLGRGQ